MINHWQDIVFSLGSIVFGIALIPAIVEKQYPPISTCIMTSIMIIMYSLADITLDLWFSAIAGIISATIWIMMGIKQIKKKEK